MMLKPNEFQDKISKGRGRERLQFFLVFLLIGLGIAILFWKVLFLGYVPVPADILFLDPVMHEAKPSGWQRPQNELLSDHIYQFYVWHHLAGQVMQQEEKIPLWNPYFLSGQPLVANAQPALFYPPNLLLFWFSPGLVAATRVFFNIFVAGVFTYLFCRTLQISYAGSVLGAVAFAFSGAMIVGPGHAYANSLVWLPFIMWAGEKLLQHRRIYFWTVVTSLGIGLSVLGGHPETTFHNLLIFSLYFLTRIIFSTTTTSGKFRPLSAFALTLIIGFLIGAVQSIPFVSFLLQSATSSRSRIGVLDSLLYSPEVWSNLTLFLTLLYPNFFGNPAEYNYYWPFSTPQNYLEQAMYFGLIPAMLSLGAVFTTPRKRTTLILAILAALSLLIALRVPGFEAINYLPILNRINNTRLKWIFTFLAAVLAGIGLDAFRQYILSGRRENKAVFYLGSAVFGVALAILATIIFLKYIIVPIMGWPTQTFSYHLLFAIFSLRQAKTVVTMAVLLSVGIIYGLVRQRPGLVPLAETLLISITFIELIVLAVGYNTSIPRNLLFPEVKLTRLLKADTDLFRVTSAAPTFWPNYGAVYGLFNVGGYDLPVFQRYARVYRAQGGQSYRQTWSPNWPLVDWMNIKYVISPERLQSEKFELVLAESGYYLYRNKQVLPRAYMVYKAEVIGDDEAILKRLTLDGFDFRNKVILESNLPPAEAKLIESAPGGEILNSNQVKFVRYSHDQLILDVFTNVPGLLVMSELAAPGWTAQVDGQKATIYRANYAFRAVFVPAGHHTVTFFYYPWEVQLGGALSLLGGLILVIVLGLSAWQARQAVVRSLKVKYCKATLIYLR